MIAQREISAKDIVITAADFDRLRALFDCPRYRSTQAPLRDFDVDVRCRGLRKVAGAWDRLARDGGDQALEPIDHAREHRRTL